MTNIIRTLFGKKKGTTPTRDMLQLLAGVGRDAVQLKKIHRPARSYLGGDPCLPSDVQWPQYNGEPLGFLARISLSDMHARLPTDWLPREGALLFFYDHKSQPWGFDPKDRGGWAVVAVPDLEPVGDRPFRQVEGALPHRFIDLAPTAVLPSWERPEIQSLNLSDAEFELFMAEADRRFNNLPKHQLLGLPSPVQGDSMELECQLASNGVYCGDEKGYATPRAKSLEAGAADWKLLLQLDTDEDLGVMWGDAGTIYFWIEEAAARAGRFNNAWLVLQCS